MSIEAVYFTETGRLLAEKLGKSGLNLTATDGRQGRYKTFVQNHFKQGESLVFIGAVGIAVRAVAPYVCSKGTDPAVVVLDEGGQFAIPLLSGHIGGANRLARRIEAAIGATPVVTTATDVHGVFAIDDWAAQNGMKIQDIGKIKQVSAKILKGEAVSLEADEVETSSLPNGLFWAQPAEVYIGANVQKGESKLHIIPRCCVLGVGCKKGSSEADIEALFAEITKEICEEAFFAVASLDLKKDEGGLLAFCKTHRLPFHTFSAEELGRVPGQFTASAFVEKTTGVDNVCERSAAKMADHIVVKKTTKNGVSMAVGQTRLKLHFE